jgi:hypothetical protein
MKRLIFLACGALIAGQAFGQWPSHVIDAFKQQCAAYGFQPGTDGFASCMQRIDESARRQVADQDRNNCQDARRKAQYWCSSAGASQVAPAVAGLYCGEAQANIGYFCK